VIYIVIQDELLSVLVSLLVSLGFLVNLLFIYNVVFYTVLWICSFLYSFP